MTVGRPLACITALLFLLLPCSRDAYPLLVPPSHLRHVRTLLGAAENSVRAGSDGYSILRRPANWDVEKDPEFDVPVSLRDDEPHKMDDEWWSGRKQRNVQQFTSTKRSNDEVEIEEEEELNLFQRSLNTLDFPRILRALHSECTTVPAKAIIQQAAKVDTDEKKKAKQEDSARWMPLVAGSVEEAQDRYAAVDEMTRLLDSNYDRASFRNRLGYKQDLMGRPPPFAGQNGFALEPLLALARSRVLEGDEILQVSDMLDCMEDVALWREGLEKHGEFLYLPAIASDIQVNATLQDLLHNAFEDKDGVGRRLSGSTFPPIGRLRARVRSLKAEVLGTLETLLPSIQSKLNLESGGALYSEVNGGRLVVPVDPKHASSIGIVHDTSRSGKTVYVEPREIIGTTNELRQAEGDLKAEEARVWRLLTEQILLNRVPLERAVYAIGQLDLVLARVLLGRRLSGVIPDVRNEGIVELRNAKHPVLLLRGISDVVGSDISLGAGKNQGLVLTGPNAGGKTVILKLLGLVALMARCGIPVPADDVDNNKANRPRVDFFNPVLADIGDIQSVGGDLSTFSGHMLVCREVLYNAGKNALVLMDELGSGTDPNQGVAIAQALLEEVVEAGARVAITTHYMQLKQLAASDDRFSVAGMQFVNGRPTYKLLPGAVGESFALSVAERLGLPQRVLDRANTLLDSETRQMGDLLRDLEDQKALIDQQALEMEEKRKELATMEFQMKEERLRLEKKQLEARRIEARKFAKILEEKEQVLERVLEKLKSDPSRRVVAKSWEDIKLVKRDALTEAENVPSVLARKQKANAAIAEASAELVPIAEMRDKPDLKQGDKVVICKPGPMLGREADLIKVAGSRVEVKLNNMNLGLKLTEVALPTGEVMHMQSANGPSSTVPRKFSKARAVERALADEDKQKGSRDNIGRYAVTDTTESGATIRTESNTVDVRGCTLSTAQDRVREKFSAAITNGRLVVYILHGHGTGGVLKSKIRAWLKTEKLAKRFAPADSSDGGDAFTMVNLR